MKKTLMENNLRRLIIRWAKENNFVISPAKGMELYVQNIMNFGYCPCDKTRPTCPCPESVDEVQRKGHCLCRLYWKSLDVFEATLTAGKKIVEAELK